MPFFERTRGGVEFLAQGRLCPRPEVSRRAFVVLRFVFFPGGDVAGIVVREPRDDDVLHSRTERRLELLAQAAAGNSGQLEGHGGNCQLPHHEQLQWELRGRPVDPLPDSERHRAERLNALAQLDTDVDRIQGDGIGKAHAFRHQVEANAILLASTHEGQAIRGTTSSRDGSIAVLHANKDVLKVDEGVDVFNRPLECLICSIKQGLGSLVLLLGDVERMGFAP
jgi:hypothetical protein